LTLEAEGGGGEGGGGTAWGSGNIAQNIRVLSAVGDENFPTRKLIYGLDPNLAEDPRNLILLIRSAASTRSAQGGLPGMNVGLAVGKKYPEFQTTANDVEGTKGKI